MRIILLQSVRRCSTHKDMRSRKFIGKLTVNRGITRFWYSCGWVRRVLRLTSHAVLLNRSTNRVCDPYQLVWKAKRAKRQFFLLFRRAKTKFSYFLNFSVAAPVLIYKRYHRYPFYYKLPWCSDTNITLKFSINFSS